MVIKENCCNFIVLDYKVLQYNNRYAHRGQSYRIILQTDNFCKFFMPWWKIYVEIIQETSLSPRINFVKVRNHGDNDNVHDSGYRCLKHFYLGKACKHLRYLFPKVVSFNRFVKLEKEVAVTLELFIKKVLLGKMYRYKFRGQHTSESMQEPKDTHP